VKVQELQTEVGSSDGSSEVSVDGLLESCVHCREMLQDHMKQLQYLIDLHHKVHKVMSTSVFN